MKQLYLKNEGKILTVLTLSIVTVIFIGADLIFNFISM